jgi:hypothetical protein
VVSSIVPIFGGSGFDAEATQNLGKAYDIACRSLHVKGQPPIIQETLAKKIIQAAQRGERDPDRLAAIALGILGPFHRDVTLRFGLIPNFFVSAPDAPEIVEKLWDFAKSAYLDNPIPALFKERLFVFLSRFCQVRYWANRRHTFAACRYKWHCRKCRKCGKPDEPSTFRSSRTSRKPQRKLPQGREILNRLASRSSKRATAFDAQRRCCTPSNVIA